ncbi:hypothetical protein [Dyella sp. S184]|uniref:hypothetical protein n=1 Tax=Dyella sp. S184 TaxID=1641862 RepID=UPI00131B8BE6|nr:hypothetical protein [Dyella sp. S184]
MLLLRVTLAALLMGMSSSAFSEQLKHVSFDEFTGKILPFSIPLRMSVPETYERVEANRPGASAHYWMTHSDAQLYATTGEMPHGAGYMSWKTTGVRYDAKSDLFTGAEGLDSAQEAMLEASNSNIHRVRCKAGRYPVLLADMVNRKTGIRIRLMYVATFRGSESLSVRYITPSLQHQLSDELWADVKQGLDCTLQPTPSSP